MTIFWHGIITGADFETSDHRVLENVTWRDLPLTLRIQTEDFGAHDGASPVASIASIEARSVEELTAMGFEIPEAAKSSQPYYARGPFSESEAGQLAALWVEEKVLRGVSVDPGAIEYVEELIDPSTGAVVEMEQIYETWDQIDAAQILGDEAEEARLYEWLDSLYYRVRFTAYEIAAATLVATPAIGWAVIEIDAEATAAAGGAAPEPAAAAAQASGSARERLAALRAEHARPSSRQRLSGLIRQEGQRRVAAFGPGRMIAADGATFEQGGSAARRASATAERLRVAAMPAAAFEPEKLPRLTKWTIEADGRMHGHLFSWDGCHRSFTNRCETPEFMRRDIEDGAPDFHVGDALLDDGSKIRVGVLTHLDLHAGDGELSAAQLTRLMEDTGQQLGPVRLHADEFGVQACGQLWDDVDPTTAARALAGFPSYDARMIAGRWKLFGLHNVNTPGQTIYEEEGDQLRMVASMAPAVGPAAQAALAGAGGSCGCGGSHPAASGQQAASAAPGGCSCAQKGKAKLTPSGHAQLASLDEAMAARRRLARSGA